VLQGEAGSAKSTGVRVIRELLDPNKTPLRSEPRETRDLMIAAQNAWALAFDNISHLSWRLSDDLCRLATGGGFSTRRLYTDEEEQLFEATRPLLLNGIDGVVSRGDLASLSEISGKLFVPFSLELSGLCWMRWLVPYVDWKASPSNDCRAWPTSLGG